MPLHMQTTWGLIIFFVILTILVTIVSSCASPPSPDVEVSIAAYQSYHLGIVEDISAEAILARDFPHLTQEQRERAIELIEGIEHQGR